LLALLGGGCSEAPAPGPAGPGASAASAASAATAPAAVQAGGAGAPADPAPAGRQAQPAAAPRQSAGVNAGLADDWDDYRRRAAQRIVALSQASTYDGPAPEPLLAIPVLEIALNADGSVRTVHVLRRPGQAQDTVQLAIAAVRRAAPFGSVSHLPRPWSFTEVFLFDDARRFKPRSLDDG
jgi:protein TonB